MLLCIAAATINQAATKRVPDRHRAVLQAFAFLQEYSDARCCAAPAVPAPAVSAARCVCWLVSSVSHTRACHAFPCPIHLSIAPCPALPPSPLNICCRCNPQEAAYNIGRAAHHLSLLHIAVPYYERALEAAPPPSAAASGAWLGMPRALAAPRLRCS